MPDTETTPMLTNDGIELLCKAVHGRPARPREYIGGSKATILYDATQMINALKAEGERLKKETEDWKDSTIYAATGAAAMEKQVELMKWALEKFGEHRSDYTAERRGEAAAVCELVSTTSWSPGQRKPVCTCGLDAALAKLDATDAGARVG